MIRVFVQAVKILSILALTVAIAGGSVWFFDYWTERSASEMEGRPVTIEIAQDDDGGTVAEKLTDAGLVRYGFYFEQRLRFGGAELRPGTYTLRVGMSVPEILQVVTVPDETTTDDSGDAATSATNQPGFQVTFIEGQRIEQNAQVVEEAGLENGAADYIAAARDVDQFRSNYAFLESVPERRHPGGVPLPEHLQHRRGRDSGRCHPLPAFDVRVAGRAGAPGGSGPDGDVAVRGRDARLDRGARGGHP